MLPAKVLKTIEKGAMVSPGDTVLVALSGGPDSTALLHVLHELGGGLECAIAAAHLNHMLRGRESDEDERRCSEVAAELGIEFRSERIDVAAEAGRRGANLEETGRELRYRFLERVADALGAHVIAVGHTADDQAETVLLRLLRGAAGGGLRGMRLRRGRIIRPLLEATRKEVMQYLAERGLFWRDDSSNLDERFARVFLRMRVIPLLRELNPSLGRTISTAAVVLGEEDDFLNELADGVIRDTEVRHPAGRAVDASAFAELPAALQRRILRRMLAEGRGNLRSIHFNSVEAMRLCALGEGPAVDLGGLVFTREDEALLLRPKPESGFEAPEFSYSARPGQTIRVKEVDKSFSLRNIEVSDGVDFKKLSGPGRALLDADAVGEVVEVRNWLPGDRYRPLGAPGSRKLQDLFINSKIPRPQRLAAAVFLSRGRICWVSGLRISEEFRITPETERILVIEEVNNG